MPTSPERERPSLPRAARARLSLGAAAVVGLLAAGCEAKAGAFDVPWAPPSAGPVASAPVPIGPPAPGSQRRRRTSATPSFECDELPSLTAEELAGPPYDFDLQKPKPSGADPDRPPRYTVLSGVTLSAEAAAAMERIDDAYYKKTGQRLVITSGTRDAALQAKAMYKMIRLGADIMGLYRNKAAAREIKAAYARASGKSPEAVIGAMYDTIRDQISRGVYISAHLRAGAVDIRNRTMSASQRKAFEQIVAEVSGASLLEETKPPHYHLQLDPQ